MVHVGRGKGGDALKAFWKRLRHSRARVEAVATDMSAAYIDAVRTSVPDATLVFDHSNDVEFVLDPVTVRKGRAHTALKINPSVQGEKAVITF